MKRNVFLTAALESLQQEASIKSEEPSIATATPADGPTPGDGPLTQTNPEAPDDAVAELMEKNSSLEDDNATLQAEVFDNDVDAIATTSDSATQDLEEAATAGAALEELAYICDFAAKNGQATNAGVAGYAMALEQMCYRAGLTNPIAALEAETAQLEGPGEKTASIGETAKAKAVEIGKKLMEGISRLIGYLINVVRQLMARGDQIAKKAESLLSQVDSIDESKTITSGPFIASMRLVEGAGDPSKQYEDYARMASKTLYGFFNDKFITAMSEAIRDVGGVGGTSSDFTVGTLEKLTAILKALMGSIYTEHGSGADVTGTIPATVTEQMLTVGKTPACVGGLQLALAATLEPKSENEWFCHSGPSKTQPKTDARESIPVIDKATAKQMLNVIGKWMKDQKELERQFAKIQQKNRAGQILSTQAAKKLLSVMTALSTGCVPYLIRLNLHNSATFVAYVEKSIAVSKGAAEPEAK